MQDDYSRRFPSQLSKSWHRRSKSTLKICDNKLTNSLVPATGLDLRFLLTILLKTLFLLKIMPIL